MSLLLNQAKNNHNKISLILSEGADERIFPDDNGLMKYGISVINTNLINRGSCTCSPLTLDDQKLVETKLEECSEKEDWVNLLNKQTIELKKLFGSKISNNFEIYYGPSGTDLVYYPLLFSRLLHPKKKILNIVTCMEELGSGSKFACDGKFYADYNQFGDQIPKGKNIFKDDILKTVFFNARSEKGEIIDHDEEICKYVAEYSDHSIIINLVLGSKSGIEDNLDLIDKLNNENIIWNIDLCQFRHSRETINLLLEKNAMVMITGSKFFQAPPFCAALLVPEAIQTKILNSENWVEHNNLRSIFSKYDLPLSLQGKTDYRNEVNPAGLLRWVCTLSEFEKYFKLDEKLIIQKFKLWNQSIRESIKKITEFELMPEQDQTLDTIISFRIKFKGNYLNNSELKKLHRNIVTDDYSDKYDFNNIFIGQPVQYGDKSFLRVAIGAKNIREFIETDEQEFLVDKTIMSIIRSKLTELYDY